MEFDAYGNVTRVEFLTPVDVRAGAAKPDATAIAEYPRLKSREDPPA